MVSDELKNSLRKIHAWTAQNSLDFMCERPKDAWYWLESPYAQFIGDFDNLLPFFLQWEKSAPFIHRCYIYSSMNPQREIDEICRGLAFEAASLGGIDALDKILGENRPSLLPHLRDFISRFERVEKEAGSQERMREIGREAQNCFTMNEENCETGRQILARSGIMMDGVMGPGTAEHYLQGGELKIEGRNFDFVAKKGNRDPVRFSFQTFHVGMPYELSLHAKDGTYLATGCLYVPNCPVLDQISALYMTVKSGEEDDAIRTGNWTQRSEAFDAHLPPEIPTGMPEIMVAEKIFFQPVKLSEFAEMFDLADELQPVIAERMKLELSQPEPARLRNPRPGFANPARALG